MDVFGDFDLSGRAVERADFVSVRREGDIIVLEFINNAVLPIILVEEAGGKYSCWVRDFKLFAFAVRADAVIHVSRNRAVSANDASVRLSVRCGLMKYDINVVTSVSDGIQFYSGSTKAFVKEYSGESMAEWLREHGIERPIGCAMTGSMCVGVGGCSLAHQWGRYIINFPNGFRFPFDRKSEGVRIVSSDIALKDAVVDIFVQVRELSAEHVVFDVSIATGLKFVQARGIVYTVDYAEYDGSRIKSSDITKQLLLGGNSHGLTGWV